MKDFSKEIIRDNPDNLVEACRKYFEEAIKKRDGGKKQVAEKKKASKYNIEEIGKEAAADAMKKYDDNGDGNLSKKEAEPMFKEAFTGL